MNEEALVELKDEEGYEIISPIKALKKQQFSANANCTPSEITKMYFVKFFQIISWKQMDKALKKDEEVVYFLMNSFFLLYSLILMKKLCSALLF